MRAIQLIELLEQFAPLNHQESWDNSGLMVGDLSMEVKGVLIALDFTEELVEEAIELGANLIITHHPLIFKGLKRVGRESYIERIITQLIKHDILAYSIHTNIDRVPNGVSGLMADRLELKEREILQPQSGEEVGLGIIGNLEKPLTPKSFIERLKKSFELDSLRSSKEIEGAIERVALCGGSGSSLIPAAMELGAQVLVTGDISYHHYFTENNFMVMDIGHWHSEIGVLDLLVEIILKKKANFALYKSKTSRNPIYYH